MMEMLRKDLQLALRGFRRSPAFTAIAVLTLALGIGANSAIFSVVNAALIRALPFDRADSLVILHGTVQRAAVERRDASYPDFLDWRAQSRLTEGMAGFVDTGLTLGGPEPERVRAEIVSASYFSLLGLRPALGRLFREDEDLRGAEATVLLSQAFWQRQFGGDPAMIGGTITLEARPFLVVGVLPAGFRGLTDSADLWVTWPGVAGGQMTDRGTRGFPVLARLKPGVTIAQAQAEIAQICRALELAYPATNEKRSAEVVSLSADLMSDVRPALLAVLGAVVLVLLIACANVASLLLGRAEARQREMALRTALGASRGRLRTQLIVEGLALTSVAGVCGLLLSRWAADALLHFSPVAFPGFVRAELDPTVLAFTLGVSLLAGVLLGLAPLWQIDVTRLAETLKEDAGRGTTLGRGRLLFRQTIIVAEVALALMLLVGAGLFVRSLAALGAVDPGFRTDHLLTLSVGLPPAPQTAGGAAAAGGAPLTPPASASGSGRGGTSAAAAAGAGATTQGSGSAGAGPIAPGTQAAAPPAAPGGAPLLDILQRLRAIPGVERVSAASDMPLSGGASAIFYTAEGQAAVTAQDVPRAYIHRVLPGFFATLGLDLLAGRDFTPDDQRPDAGIVIVSENVARRFWPGPNGPREAIGKRIKSGRAGSDAPWSEIVGVVRETRYRALPRNPTADPDIFLPMPARGARGFGLLLRTRLDPDTLADTVRRELRAAAPTATLTDVASMEARVALLMGRARFVASLTGLFAGVALLLAAIGVYGVMAQAVARRTQEIGVRMALGASAGDIVRLVILRGLRLVAIGIAAGSVGALLLGRLLRAQLFGVGAADPVTFAGVALLLAAVALLASSIPAWRAMRVDPLVALRHE